MTFKEAFVTEIDNPGAQVENGYSKTYNTKIYGKDMVVVDGIALKHQGDEITNPRGTIFLTMSDSTGSKFYNPISEDAWYAAKSLDDRSQLFSKLIFSKHQFQVITKDVTGKIQDTFTINKTDKALNEGVDLLHAKNKNELAKAVNKAKALSTRVVYDDLSNYMEAVEKANALLEDKTATQETIDAAVDVPQTKLSQIKILKSEAKEEEKTNKKDTKKESKANKDDKKASEKAKKSPAKSSNPKTGLTGLDGILFLLS